MPADAVERPDSESGTKPISPIDSVETEMAVLARTLERHTRQSEIHRDLDRASYLLARTLEREGPISINTLAAALGLDPTTVTRQVATMESRRLVTRSSEPGDRRVSVIGLSEKGRREMERVRRLRRARLGEVLTDWSEDEEAELGRLLTKLNRSLAENLDRRAAADNELRAATAPLSGRNTR
jgi:DNA-binding MarR family transcriptional regulator